MKVCADAPVSSGQYHTGRADRCSGFPGRTLAVGRIAGRGALRTVHRTFWNLQLRFNVI